MLNSLNIKQVYSSSTDNILNDFYIPVLKEAVQYDRISGFFTPKVLAIAARGMAEMISNGGKIRLITSIQVDPETYRALDESRHSLTDAVRATNYEDSEKLQNDLEKDYYTLFKTLLRDGILELRIAVSASDIGILHEKIGLVTDTTGKSLSFSGSNNETVYGWTKNVEEFKIFPGWEISTARFYQHDREKFDNYWNNNEKSIKVYEIDGAFKHNIFKLNELTENTENLVNRIEHYQNAKDEVNNTEVESKTASRELRDYQIEAINHWESSDYISIFEMATGTGKTFTSISALSHQRKQNGFLHCVVVVPLVTLVEQWKNDIASIIPDIAITVAAGSNHSWRSDLNSLSINRTLGNDADYIVITTYSTFSSEIFRDFINTTDNDITLVTDEMHNLVTDAGLVSAQNSNFKYRLGLSATPTRLWKQDESAMARKLFGNDPYLFSLERAISENFLVPYSYFIKPVFLTEGEYLDYQTLSKQISKLASYGDDSSSSQGYAMALTKRARIKKQAENKLYALELLVNTLRSDDNISSTLMYVDSNKFLTDVQNLLTKTHIKSSKFTGSESLQLRLDTINNLRNRNIDVIIAIKCLDEGVDIPSAINGIFLSNNTDPREYVQRLGRVLRRDDLGGKKEARVFDYLVLPPPETDRSDAVARNLVKGEVIRATFFKNLATNKYDVGSNLGEILDNYGYFFEPDELSYDQGKETG